MKKTNADLKKVLERVKKAQGQLQSLLENTSWLDDARKYAEKQGKEVRKLFTSDVNKVKTFLEKERRELEKFQKQIPGEVKKFRKFVVGQRKELKKLLANVRKTGAAKVKAAPKARKASGKKTAGSAAQA